MSCKKVEKRLTEDVKKALTDSIVQEHLRICRRCQRLSDELASLEDLSRSLRNRREAPADFASRLLAKREESGARQHFWKPVLTLLVIGLLSSGILWLHPSESGISASDTVLSAGSEEKEKESIHPLPALAETQEVPMPYFDVILDHFPEQGHVLRLPPTIEIRRTELHHDFYLHHVSY